LKNANLVLRCLAKHLRVGTLAKRIESAASYAVLHSPEVSSVALDCLPDPSGSALTRGKSQTSTLDSGMHWMFRTGEV
jgi:hypothetical protein